MKYFIFRNFTIEPLFSNLEAEFSGYNDISEFNSDADTFIWFYSLSLNPDNHLQSIEIDHFYDKVSFLIKNLPSSKDFYIFTLVDLFSFKWQNSDFTTDNKISEFNKEIIAISKINPNIKLIDLADFVKEFDA